TREEVIGQTAAELGLFVHPEEQRKVARQLLMQRHIANVETQIRCKDGTIRDGLFWGEIISSQGYDYFLTVMIDVTERNRAEKALRESERQYRELYTTAQRQMHELSLLNQVRTTLARELNLPTIFHDVVEAIAETFGYTLVSLYLREDDELVLQHQVGYTQVFERIPVTKGVSGRVARTGEPILLQDVHTDPAFLEAVPNITAEVCVPLIDQGQTVGILNVESNDPTALTEADLELLVALSEHINIAIERARLYAQVRERERHLDLFFTQSLDGFFFMMLDEPLHWDETVDKAQVLDYVFTHQRITRVNDAMLAQYGATREQFLGLTPHNFFAHDPVHGRAIWRSLFDAGHLHVDTDERKLDGTPMWIEGDYVCLYDSQGRITGHFGVQRDVTEQRRIVHTLEDREHFLAALNDITQAALETSDLTAMLQILADRMGELFHADGCYLTLWDEARQQTVVGAAYGAWRDRYRAVQLDPDEPTVTASVLRAGHTLAIEDVYDTPYLSSRIAELFPDRSLLGLPLIAAERKLGAALIAYNDTHVFTPLEIARGEQVARQIALAVAKSRLYQDLQAYAGQLEERVRARTAELQAHYAQLDAILRSVDDAIFMTDPDRRILYVNPAFTEQTGYASMDILGKTVCSLGILGNFETLLPSIMPTLTQGKFWQGELLGRRKDGRLYDTALTITPVHDEAELITGYVFTHRDISQAKDLERARNQFITNVSHQFRTPVTTLKLGVYLMQRAAQSEEQKQQLQMMETRINWLIQLIEDTLEISALDSGKGITTWESVSIPGVIEDVIQHYQDRASDAGLTLEITSTSPNLPSIKGDASRLAQALSEVVENAVAFTPAGGHVMITTQTSVADGDDWITVAVQDTGPGIAAEELPRVFERFFRGSLAESGHTAGTGLGLSIAQKIAEAHGGHITVESTIGQGSTFTLWLRPDLPEGGSRT
ncbi:MAG: PAS domain S-box protein, partial [Anaerolineae bacterium]|nr:PAS domain S-box protein [Anaerolineae bacterium]